MSLSISQEYKDIAEQLITKYSDSLGHIDVEQILFLSEDARSPKKFADIQLVKYPYQFITNYKFIITVYQPKIIAFTPAQLNILILHEISHISEDGEKLLQHDVQDFVQILSTYGVDWSNNPAVDDPLA